MNEHNRITDLRKEWERLPSKQLEGMLHAELDKAAPDDDVVLQLLHILEAREPDEPVKLTTREEESFRRYRQQIRNRRKKTASVQRWLSVAASLVLVIFLVFAIVPQQAEAETFWDMITRWTESVLQFFDPDDRISSIDYVFKTDHPGLQQVYDAVVELGVTDPVVPMWIPEGYELVELKEKNTPKLTGICTTFSNGEKSLVYEVVIYAEGITHEYYIDDEHAQSFERNGMNYNIAQNNGLRVAVWTKDRIECSLTIDCQEETLLRILNSIYTTEDS